MINKIKEVSELLKDKNIDIEVDGSIDDKTAVLCQAAGANILYLVDIYLIIIILNNKLLNYNKL